VAGKIIADIIEAPYDAIRMNVGNVTVLTANSSGLNYIPTGNVNVTIGGANANLTMNILSANGIKFPATQVSSADANTLDDYEEGTWTPTMIGWSGTYNTQRGYYTKIGNLVQLNGEVVVTASSGSFSDFPCIASLPFSISSSSGSQRIHGHFAVTNGWNAASPEIGAGVFDSNGSTAFFGNNYRTGDNAANLSASKLSASANVNMRFSATYRTS